MAEAPSETAPEPQPASSPAEAEETHAVLERRWQRIDSYRDEDIEAYATRRQRTRNRRVYTLVAFMLALAGAFAGLLTWLQPVRPPYFVPLFITEYQSTLVPANQQADPDRVALTGTVYFPRIDQNAFSSQERHLFLDDLAALRERAANDSVLVYISAFAAPGPDNRLYLFPADVEPDNTGTWVALESVLQYVRECPARKKLLVLDILKPLAHVRVGVLANDAAALVPTEVARMQQKMLDNGEDPAHLGLVLASCSPGQISLSSEAMSRSVFNYYFEEALRGWAEIYNDQRTQNGRITVMELADFVKRRVDRWANLAHDTRQTPLLLGSGPDFPLVALEHGVPLPYVPLPEAPTYPDWLLKAWQQRDAWNAERVQNLDPRIMQQFDSWLLRAESQWRGGINPQRVQTALASELDRLSALRVTAEAQVAYPTPRSLALAVKLGQQPDSAIAQDLQDLWSQLEQQLPTLKPDARAAAKDKLVKGFLTKHKKATAFQIAWSVFDVANIEANPSADLIRFLNEIRGHYSKSPIYIETEFLARLVDLASAVGDGNWPQSTVRVALNVVRKGEQAVVDPRSFAWVRGILDQAIEARYNAEVVLFARGYAPLDLAQQRFARADDLYDIALAHEATVQRAQRLRDRSFSFLTYYIEFLTYDPSMQKTWHDALNGLDELDKLLAAPPRKPLAADQLRQQGEDLRQKTDTLERNIERLNWPFIADHLASLIRQSADRDATPAVAQMAGAVLELPYLKAEDRQALWQARIGLTRRLAQSVLDRDVRDDNNSQLTSALADYSRLRERYEDKRRQLGLIRGHSVAALLKFSGVKPADYDRLMADLNDAESEKKGLFTAAAVLRQAWSKLLPEVLYNQKDLHFKDRIARIIPPFERVADIDEPKTNPAVELRAEQANALFNWLDEFYRYRSRDLNGSNFYADLAIEYRRSDQSDQIDLTIEGCSTLALTLLKPSAKCTLGLTLFTPAKAQPKAALNIVTADDVWLNITPDLAELPRLSKPGTPIRACSVPLAIALKAGAELSRTVRPSGFLIEIQIGDRVYHRLAPLSSLPPALADRLELALSASPSGPAAPIDELRLRPVAGQQNFYLFVQNPTTKARKVTVQLYDAGKAIGAAKATIDVPANTTQLVKFGQPAATTPASEAEKKVADAAAAVAQAADAAKKPANLPPFKGPLSWRLVDAAKTDDILDEKVVPVGIATPREYVGVSQIRFTPPSPTKDQNLLEVKLRSLQLPLPPPPCNVQLILPPKRIPGLLSAKDGNFRGVLPADGDPLLLYASNIKLADGANPQGYIYVQVDGQKRAFIFNVTFARSGAPTSPTENLEPAVRIDAPKFARSSADFAVDVEVDNPPPGATLEVSLGQKIQGVFTPDLVETLPHARNRYLGFAATSKDGALLFQASDSDWHLKLDTSGIRGPRVLRARMLDQGGKLVKEAFADVILDDSPPDNVRFVEAPSTAGLKGTVNVSATGQDNQSGIAKVEFFWGKPVMGAMPPKIPTTAGSPSTMADQKIWSAAVPIMGVPPGKNDLSVAFTNGVGMVSFATVSINLTDADPSKGPGKIVGVVTEGSRPQPGLTVSLTNDSAPKSPQSKPAKITKTKSDGSYAFDKLAPGKYTLSCSKQSSGRVAKITVEVPPDQTVTANMPLYLP